MAVTFRAEVTPDGVRIVAERRRLLLRSAVPPAEWASLPDPAGAAGRALARAIAGGEAQEDGTGGVVLAHRAAAGLPGSLAETLGLPALARLSATLSFEGRIDQADGRIRIRWYDDRIQTVTAARTGAFLKRGDEHGRLTGALFALTEAIDAYNASRGRPVEERLVLWQPVQEALERATGRSVDPDPYLKSLTIYQAGSFALDVRETRDGPDFVPVLMSRSKARSLEDDAPAGEDGEEDPAPGLRDEVADALLPPELQKSFVSGHFERASRDAYVLGRNVFVVLDPDLKRSLDVVREMRRAPAAARRAFLRNPRPALAQALGREGAEATAAELFVETNQYSERVLGLGVWEKPNLPWLQGKAGQWLPEGFVLRIGGATHHVTAQEAEEIARTVAAARDAGEETVAVGGETYPVPEVEEALKQGFSESARPDYEPPPPEPEDDAAPQAPPEDRQVLIVQDNLDGVAYAARVPPRPAAIAKAMPDALMGATRPKAHQREGFEWLVEAWSRGSPGVLLADDMGLGKTFQALAFLAWIRANRAAPERKRPLTPLQRGPILIVAPTALLNNWAAEAERHLAPGALGERVDAFGSGLRRLKRPRSEGWSPEDALDVEALRAADWILTTYETLADNHRAFARVGYALAVFDEMQKVKDPRTINTHAAKTLNADFVLGLTGTPIENRLEDLWCIMDRVAPGYLGGLKAFSEEHAGEDPDALMRLKARLDGGGPAGPPIMLRRMKEGLVEGLPTKTVVPYPTPMPDAQAEAYTRAVAEARNGERSHGAMLKAIHALRGISLHPERDEVDPYDARSIAAWIARSGRLSRGVEILRGIEAKGEKALVFIEDRAVQRAFAAAAGTLFRLPTEPEIVNGEVPGHRRQEIVDRFQAGPPGFGLLVLSPKAAGIGLTITAANHVLHLSRWWNPAVEDQCNDRCYRIGQAKDVTVHVPIGVHPAYGDGSFDVTLDRLLARKRELSRHMLSAPVSDGDVGALFGATVGEG